MTRFSRTIAGALALLLVGSASVHAEAHVVRISRGYGIPYLPLMIMEHGKLLEKQAQQAGLGEVKVEWPTIDGGNNINTAMIAGALDIAGIGAPGFLALWAKAKGNPAIEVGALAALSSVAMYLNTRNPDVKTLKDFTDKDRIALPGIKTSLSAFILEMAAAKVFGDENYAKLDPLTVGMPYPEAYAALISGKTEIDSHFASPPYSVLELEHPGIHLVLNSVDLFGNLTIDVVYASKKFHDANPQLCAAFIRALEEADAFIARDAHAAAKIYTEMAATKMSVEQVERMISDKDTRFSTVPDGTMKYAEFMSRVGIIKVKPKAWTDYFFPEAAAGAGS